MSDTLIYGGYTQAELDAQYEQRTLVHDFPAYLDRWRSMADAVERSLPVERHIPYGVGANETFDAFLPALGRGMHIHVHGGAWKALSSRDSWFLAPSWVSAGYAFITLNFDLVPAIPLAEQVSQVRRGLLGAIRWAAGRGLEMPPIISGHSSGAHLAALATLAADDAGSRPAVAASAVILASGVYDLEPVRLSRRNHYLNLTAKQAEALSPGRCLAATLPPVRIFWSSNELAEFQRQSVAFADAVRSRGGCITAMAVDAATHFDTWDMIVPSLCQRRADPLTALVIR